MLACAVCLLACALAAANEIVSRHAEGMTWAVHDIVFAGAGIWLTLMPVTPFPFYAARRWPIVAPHTWSRVALHVALAVVFWLAASTLYEGVLAWLINPHAVHAGEPLGVVLRGLGGRIAGWFFTSIGPGMFVYASMVAAAHAIRYFAEAREREVQNARLAEQLTAAQFATLQSQLNPHFLFNTLNSIVVRARSGDGPATARMAEQLSEVLRRTLGRHRAHEVTLDDELTLVREYLAIEEARFSDRLRVEFDVDDALLPAAVPSFALQHLVENAIRHGIARRATAGLVRVIARRDGSSVELSVIDDGPGIGARAEIADGHGLANTTGRLRALYGEEGSLTLENAPDGGAAAAVRFPYHELAREADVA